MASVVGWLDYSEEHRQKMREIIDLFKDEDSVDELGVGSIRDTFSELLFPGLSTVQTRARYFLLIPYVYRRLEDKKVPSRDAAAKARHWQTELITSLKRGGGKPNDGIIGWEAGRNLQRLPSNVYWSGLKTYGIRLFSGSIEDYHRSLDSYQQRLRHFNKGEGDEVAETLQRNWTSHLPPTPDDLWKETSIELSEIEARFLKDQISIYCSDSLLAHLLDHPNPLLDELSAPWQHPAAADAPEEISTTLHHAELFSEVMHGAALAYNLMLAQRAKEVGLSIGDDNLDAQYAEDLADWAEDMATDSDIASWDVDELWATVTTANSRIPHTARAFAQAWITQAKTDPHRAVALPSDIQALIRDRERRLKKGKARLHSHRALEMWSGHSGTGRMTYRWPTARTVIGDIHRGLGDA